MDTQKVGKQIATLRKAKRLTQSELGERLGVSFQAVSKYFMYFICFVQRKNDEILPLFLDNCLNELKKYQKFKTTCPKGTA